jgi:serine/threonine protein kinase
MTKIGKYQIIRELGRGATSSVYLARDPFADREVALKVLNPQEMKEEEAKRFKELFLTEASLAGKIEHPYIVSIYDAVITDEISYLVMEFVGGGTLERYCQIDNLLPIDKVIEIIFKCCHALNYASQNGIVHRDIKPENILIADGTNIKISDFGAAILLKGDFSQTGHNMDVGSLAYMSPQQAQGIELNSQTDIYSLGVMFYMLLTGSLPFSAGNDAGLFFQILNVEPRLPSTYRLDIPKAIDDIVTRAIAKDLEDRFQSWNEFEQALVAASIELPKEVSSFTDTEKFNTLSRLGFFKDFSELELWEVLRISKWAFYPEGTSIIREGDETASFFIIISGEAEIRKNGRGIATLNAGVCFGEMSGVRKGAARRRAASVHAHKDIKLIEINEQSLSQASENCQRGFDKAFLEILAERLASAGTQDKSRIKTKAIAHAEAVKVISAEPGKDRVSERTEVERAVQMHGNPAKPGRLVPQPWVAVEIAGVKLNVPTLIGILILIVLVHFISIPQLFQTILGNT